MGNLESQINRIEKKFVNKLNKAIDRLSNGIKKDLFKMIQKRVPIDTETLKDEGITIESYENQNGLTIDVFVNDLQLDYGRQSIKASVLGLILDVGVSRGKDLMRTRSQPRNPARTPTQGWFTEDFIKDVELYLKNREYEKWLKL